MRLGIDLGGTKTEIVALEGAEQRWRKRVPTPSDDYDAIISAIVDLHREATQALGVGGTLGIGTPGSVSPKTGLMRNCNTQVLNGRPLRADVEAALGREVRLANDANCFALSEATDGAGAGAAVVFGVILGTGVGGGLVVDGRLLEGHNGIAGEWGHSPCPRGPDELGPGPLCYCGRRGCVETLLSGPALAAEHQREFGGDASAAELVGLASAAPLWERYEARLARALGTVVNLLDPDVIVLGGGLSNVARLYEHVPPLLAEHAFSDVFDTPILPAQHGDSSGVRGAACLWP
ncbi:MAG: ROK family protein [Nannocystales bacterium]